METIAKVLTVLLPVLTLLLGCLGIVILRQRAAVLRGARPSPLFEQLSFITFPGEEPKTKYYGPLFLGALFTIIGLWSIVTVLRVLINQ